MLLSNTADKNILLTNTTTSLHCYKVQKCHYFGEWRRTVDSSEVGFIVSSGFVGKVLCDVHVSLHFLLHLLQGGMEVHLPVLLIQALHELLQLRLGAIVPDLFLLVLTVFFTGGWEQNMFLDRLLYVRTNHITSSTTSLQGTVTI